MADSNPGRESELVHRLKNHLCIIVGFCDLVLADTPETDARHADLLEIQKAAQDAMAMMADVSARVRAVTAESGSL